MKFLKVCCNFDPLCKSPLWTTNLCCFSKSLYYFNANLLTENMMHRYQASRNKEGSYEIAYMIHPSIIHIQLFNSSYAHSMCKFINDKLQFHNLIITNDPLPLKTIKGY